MLLSMYMSYQKYNENSMSFEIIPKHYNYMYA